MKKIIFAVLACIALAMPSQVSAQSYHSSHRVQSNGFFEQKNIYYGFRIGGAFASINSEYLDAGSMKGGLNIGGVVGFGLLDEAPLYIESGLMYSQKGGKGKVGTATATYNANYLELPITFKYALPLTDKISVQPMLGMYAALGVGGSIKINETKVTEGTFGKEDYKLKRGDIGLKIGCGGSYDIFYAELYYDLGLANVGHDKFDAAHNGALVVNVGVNF